MSTKHDSRLLSAATRDPMNVHLLLLLSVICRMQLLLLVVLASTAGELQLQVSLDTPLLAVLDVHCTAAYACRVAFKHCTLGCPIWLIQSIQLRAGFKASFVAGIST